MLPGHPAAPLRSSFFSSLEPGFFSLGPHAPSALTFMPCSLQPRAWPHHPLNPALARKQTPKGQIGIFSSFDPFFWTYPSHWQLPNLSLFPSPLRRFCSLELLKPLVSSLSLPVPKGVCGRGEVVHRVLPSPGHVSFYLIPDDPLMSFNSPTCRWANPKSRPPALTFSHILNVDIVSHCLQRR